ncbi:MAG: Uma2 family endonuclease, partial [Armatimonadetes bacterium]|nr:Uma2 family endonuclease [Anaerolineae bacterium]
MVTSEQARIAQSNNIIAVGVTVDEYMEHYAGDWCEYVDGQVIKLYPNGATWMDNNFIFCIHTFLSAYCGLRPVGQVFRAPFVIALPAFPQRRREPDLMVRLHTSAAILHPTYLEGAADICIEVVSPESVTRDYADKLVEYEQGGVGEYWVLDRQRR